MVVNGHLGVSEEMALRFSKALGTIPELWLNIQQGFDLCEAQQKTMDIQVRNMRDPDVQIEVG